MDLRVRLFINHRRVLVYSCFLLFFFSKKQLILYIYTETKRVRINEKLNGCFFACLFAHGVGPDREIILTAKFSIPLLSILYISLHFEQCM